MSGDCCDFHYKRPWLKEDLGPGCQFTDETSFHPCDEMWFCRFHLPLTNKDGEGTAKAHWTDDEHAIFVTEIDEIIAAAKKAEEPADLTGVVFPRKMYFIERSLPETRWCATQWADTVTYRKTTFLGHTWFEDANFLSGSEFEDATFAGHALFGSATFSGNAIFRYSTFLGDASFEQSTFSGNTVFRGAEFLRNALFDDATFLDRALFDDATVSGEALFANSNFSSTALFRDTIFAHLASFDHANFSGNASFRDAIFSDDASFHNTTYSGSILFDEATFSGDTDFSWGGRIGSKAEDVFATEEGDSTKKVRYGVSELGVLQRFEFSGGFVRGIADFSNRTFKQAADFSRRRFEKPPRFHGADIHQGTKWRNAFFGGTEEEDAEQDYRTLRLAMEKIRDRPQEGVFFALEQRAIRHQAGPWSLRSLISLGYDVFSDYGRSPGRVLAWLAATLMLFLIFYIMIYGQRIDDWPVFYDLVALTLGQVLKPFAVWSVEAKNLPLDLMQDSPRLFKFLATLQSVICLSFIALFVLALRWQFRRG